MIGAVDAKFVMDSPLGLSSGGWKGRLANRYEVLKSDDDDAEVDEMEGQAGMQTDPQRKQTEAIRRSMCCERGWRTVTRQGRRDMEPIDIGAVEGHGCGTKRLSRESGMRFNVAKVQKPLASAAKVVEAGNRISTVPKPQDNYIENTKTGEKIELRVDRGTYVFDVEFENGEVGAITLDSGAGVSVWPEGMQDQIPLMPKDPKLKMTAANGSVIENLGTKVIKFRGVEADFTGRV